MQTRPTTVSVEMSSCGDENHNVSKERTAEAFTKQNNCTTVISQITKQAPPECVPTVLLNDGADNYIGEEDKQDTLLWSTLDKSVKMCSFVD